MSATPGPWRVVPIGTWISTVDDPYGHGQMHVADVRGWGHLTGKGACALGEAEAIAIQSANGALLAAAPELLAGLKAILAGFDAGVWVRNISGDGDPAWAIKLMPHIQAMAAAVKAVEKAEGSAP